MSVPIPMARPAAQLEFIDDGLLALLEVGIVVVLQELCRPAVDARPVTLAHDPSLPGRGVTVSP